MSAICHKNSFYIESWEIIPLRNTIRRGDETHEIEPKAMQVLEYLAMHAGQPIGRDTLFQTFWPNQIVTEEALTRIISHLRHCLGDDPKSPRYIVTIRKSGYRLIADVNINGYLKQPTMNGHTVESYTEDVRASYSPSKRAKYLFVSFNVISSLFVIFIIIQALNKSPLFHMHQRYLSSEKGRELAPAISPDGQKIAYVKDMFSAYEPDKYIMEVFVKDIKTGNTTRVSQLEGIATHPTWSPDSRFIAVSYEQSIKNASADNNYAIYKINVENGEAEQLLSSSTHHHGMSWSPDGRCLIYSDGISINQSLALFQLDINTRDITKLTQNESPSAMDTFPSYSPDATKAAFVRSQQGAYDNLYLLDMATLQEQPLLINTEKISGITWKDNNILLFIAGPIAAQKLLQFSLLTHEIKPVDLNDYDMEYPTYSNVNNRLVYESIKRSTDIWMSRAAPDGEISHHQLFIESTNYDLEAHENRQGTHVAFISSRNGSYELLSKAHTDGQVTKLTHLDAELIKDIDWSPDGDKIAFIATVDGTTSLYWLNTSDEKLHSFSHGMSRYSLIGWENNNRSLLFSSNYEKDWKVWRLHIDNNMLQLITNTPITQGRLNPDRDTLYYVKLSTPGIWQSDIDFTSEKPIPGTESISVYLAWAVSRTGIYFLTHGDIAEPEKLNFLNFSTQDIYQVGVMPSVHINRFYWANDKLFFSFYSLAESDIAMVEGL